jgi:hypothetical protein
VHRCVPLQIAFGSLRPLALAAQFLHAGADGHEIVSGTGSVHVSSSIGLGRAWWPAHRLYPAGHADFLIWLISNDNLITRD